MKAGERLPDLFQGHGTKDDLVSYSWGKKTSEELNNHGVSTTFNTLV